MVSVILVEVLVLVAVVPMSECSGNLLYWYQFLVLICTQSPPNHAYLILTGD